MSAQEFSAPKQVAGFQGSQATVSRRDLAPLAKQVAVFLAEDLKKVIAKHVRGTTAEDLLHVAVYLDPRFRNHPALRDR